MPLTLTDAEVDLVHALAEPIAPSLRGDFLRKVADELEASRQRGTIGEGEIHRIARAAQRLFWTPIADPRQGTAQRRA
jgi:hypothetical protein